MFDEEHVIYRYKYLPYSEGALKALTDSTIKFTSPLEFNDPFDCNPYYDASKVHLVPSQRPDLFKAAGDRRGLSPAKRLQEKGKFIARLKRTIDIGAFARDTIARVGVVSLSKSAQNILMWSHYADFHRGFVIEFRIPIMGTKKDLPLSNKRLMPFPIKYCLHRPHVLIGIEPRDKLLEKLVLTKSRDWEYEEEERVIEHDKGAGIFDYNRDEILCTVIAGMKMTDANYNELQEIVDSISNKNTLKPTLFRAEPKNDQYKLIVPGHPRLTE